MPASTWSPANANIHFLAVDSVYGVFSNLLRNTLDASLRQAMTAESKHAFLPIGTQIVALAPGKGPKGEEVCPQGAVGVVLGPAKADKRCYQIRLTDGSVVVFARKNLAIRKHYQRNASRHKRAHEKSHLPDVPSVRQELHDLLIRLRTSFA